jgi:predicted TIM-barrel fold metal-dependent hydrolase
MWRETTQHERNAKIFREELDDFLPARILDAHTHVFGEGILPPGETYSCAGHSIAHYTVEELRADMDALFPGRQTSALCFGMPRSLKEVEGGNDYVAQACDGKRCRGLYLFHPGRETAESLAAALDSGHFLGLKPYPDFAAQAARVPVAEVEVRQMLPDWALEVVDARHGVIVLHIGRPGRLEDPVNRRQVAEICHAFPNLRVVLAHIGRAYFLRCVVGHLDELATLDNLYYDLAMLNNWEVLEYTFGHVSAERLLYGTDIPIALAPGKSVEINHQYTYVTPVPWDLSICDSGGRVKYTSFAYEEVRAIRKAVERLGLGSQFVERLFHDNAEALLASAEAGAEGQRTRG